jgi:hypothetical protein
MKATVTPGLRGVRSMIRGVVVEELDCGVEVEPVDAVEERLDALDVAQHGQHSRRWPEPVEEGEDLVRVRRGKVIP